MEKMTSLLLRLPQRLKDDIALVAKKKDRSTSAQIRVAIEKNVTESKGPA